MSHFINGDDDDDDDDDEKNVAQEPFSKLVALFFYIKHKLSRLLHSIRVFKQTVYRLIFCFSSVCWSF